MSRHVAAALLVLAAAGSAARAQPPKYHGCLRLRPAVGPFNRRDGNTTITAANWEWDLSPISSGIAPAAEQITISLGGDQNAFVIPPGAVKVKRHGTLFVYKGPRGQPRGITSLRLKMLTPMRYQVSFGLKGVDLSQLVFQSDACLPVAIVVGLDDGFNGAEMVRPGGLDALQSRRVRLTGACAVDTSQWAWLSGSGSSSGAGGSSPCQSQ
ncbi:MAG TPA: hypothetical protein VKW76_17360 [Candidatus Binatia bacterium]|nr:hypothetical protein [Candidatus Binatia bacterium]